jgi:hypothetical protein
MIARLFDQPRKPRWYDTAFLYVCVAGGVIGGPAAVYLYQHWPT